MMSSIDVSVMPYLNLLDGTNLYPFDMTTGEIIADPESIDQFSTPLHGWIQGGLYRINQHHESGKLSVSLVSRIEKPCSKKSRRKSAQVAAR